MNFILDRPDLVLDVVIEHVYLTIVAILGASVLGVILGVLITRIRSLYGPVLTVAGVIYTVPSLAMFVLMIPVLGIGFKSAVIALILYSLLIIIRNTAVGLDSVDPNIIEAARGMGMTPLTILSRVELPLALPIIFAGIRIAAVSAISLATIAAFIGAGGIGDLIFQGMSSQRDDKIVAGALSASVMAIGAEVLLRQVEKGASPGLTGDFKTIGEYVADGFAYLRTHPNIIVMTGVLLLLTGYAFVTWVKPYAADPSIAGDAQAQEALQDAGYKEMTGLDLAQLKADIPVNRSLEILPWFGIMAALIAIMDTFRYPGSRASAEVFLLVGLLAFFPLAHFYLETRRAVGDLGNFSELFRAIRSEINATTSIRVGVRPETVDLEPGFALSAVGAGLIVIGAYMKSLWFRQREQAIKERLS